MNDKTTAPSLPPLPEHAAAWVVPGDDGGSLKEWVDAKAERDGEFTAPLFTAAQMREYALAAVAGVMAFRCDHGCPAAEVCKVVKGGHAGPCKGSHGVKGFDDAQG